MVKQPDPTVRAFRVQKTSGTCPGCKTQLDLVYKASAGRSNHPTARTGLSGPPKPHLQNRSEVSQMYKHSCLAWSTPSGRFLNNNRRGDTLGALINMNRTRAPHEHIQEGALSLLSMVELNWAGRWSRQGRWRLQKGLIHSKRTTSRGGELRFQGLCRLSWTESTPIRTRGQ